MRALPVASHTNTSELPANVTKSCRIDDAPPTPEPTPTNLGTPTYGQSRARSPNLKNNKNPHKDAF